ncbi:hypothetical protein SS50377_20079 [Spironucleus salmonicida]|nr:hypothetical protein SS50377_20079 [Spironucleus salmonicida]
MVQENSALLFNDVNKTLIQLDSQCGSFQPIINDIQIILSEKEKIREQTSILELLNSENNDLVLKISQAIQNRDEYLFQLQITDVQVQEQRFMLSQLLNAAKQATTQQTQESQQQYQSLIYQKYQGSRMTKRSAVGLLGELDRKQQQKDACSECCGDIFDVPQSLKSDNQDTNNTDTDPGTDTVSQRCESYQSRITSLILEKQGLEALLARRIGELQASLARVRETLAFRDYQASRQLEEVGNQLSNAQKYKLKSEVRYSQLTSDLALMTNKGIEQGGRVKNETDNVLRNAKREMKIFQLNKQREIDKAMREADQAGIHEMNQLTKQKLQLEVELSQYKNSVKKINNRIKVLEEELSQEGEENGYLRKVLANIMGNE